MKQEETVKHLDDEIRRLKNELTQLQRAKRVIKRRQDEVVVF